MQTFSLTDSSFSHGDIVEVVLPRYVREGFDYSVPEGMVVRQGSYVIIPLGKKELVGVVWGAGKSGLSREKCKPIIKVAEHIEPMSPEMLAFITWVAWYNCAAIGMVLKMSLSVPDAIMLPEMETIYDMGNADDDFRLTPARENVMSYIKEHGASSAKAIKESSGASKAIIDGLVKSGALVTQERFKQFHSPQSHQAEKPSLTQTQELAAKVLRSRIGEGYSTTLLEGVTGSGKTEVYFEAVEKAMEGDGQVLVLLPEIALSTQWLQRFEKRFGTAAHVWHSSVSKGKRKTTWTAIANGQAKLLVGARSALFLPFKNLSAIIIDEEHEGSYKQEDVVIYHARDMAVARAHHEKVPITLVSATPSLETMHNVDVDKYDHVILPSRFGSAQMPDVALVDMRESKLPAGIFMSPALKAAMVKTIERGEQSLLFLNRRGYAPLVLCRTCGHKFTCPNCTSSLVMHKTWNRLECHHCGYHLAAPKECTECDDEDSLVPCGPGVERLEEEVRIAFPDANIATITSDSASSKEELEALIHSTISGEVDILIGTQMLAKGHHFPMLTLVGVIDADLGLSGGDLRATERTYQLLHQISGRAGREARKGHVMLQTYDPKHAVMQALAHYDGKALLKMETETRRIAKMPPFGRMVAFIVEGIKEREVRDAAHAIARAKPNIKEIRLLGPIEAPLYRLRNLYRYRMLITCPKNINIQGVIDKWLQDVALPYSIKCKTDIDPYSFL